MTSHSPSERTSRHADPVLHSPPVPGPSAKPVRRVRDGIRRWAAGFSAALLGALAGTLGFAGVIPAWTPAAEAALQARPAAAAAQDDVPPIQEEGGFYILNFSEDGAQGMKLEEFVKRCQEVTGLNFVISKDSRDQMRNEVVQMLGSKRIPKQDFYAFFQIIMFIHDFACIEVGPPGLSVIVIQTLTGPRGAQQGTIKQRAIYVLPEELERYADQPATLITTMLTLPNTEVRALTNALRPLLDANTQNFLPAGGSNSVLLTGFGASIYQFAQLLFAIDRDSAVETTRTPIFESVRLEFAAAQDVSGIVSELLQARSEAMRQVNRPRAVEGGAPQAPRTEVEPKLVVEPRTNSLIIVALPEEMPNIKELIARLDAEVVEPERNYHVYTLENVGAEDLAATLEQFLSDARRVTAPVGGTGGRTGQPAQAGQTSQAQDDVVVVPEPTTNSLLIAANKNRYAEVVELIRLLDQRQDQVLIETALIELTGQDFRDIGVELGFAEIPGVGSTGGFGVTSFGLSEFGVNSEGTPVTRIPLLQDGITAGILDGNDFSLPFLVRLFQRTESANVLSVPSILVNNNGSATISTLDEEPFTQVTAFGGAGGGQTQENFQGYQNAGITLIISPSISASRYLRLGIELEVSNFGEKQSASIPPPRVTRRLVTSVNVPDGDTMVIGGVITNNTSQVSRKTPFLGDLPLIGRLFRRDTDTERKRTLYFFVTPHILSDRDFADLAEISYRKKLEASDVIGADRVRMIDADFGRRSTEPELESFEVPLYRVPSSGQVRPEDVGLDPIRRAELLRENRNASQPAAAAPVQANGEPE